MADMIGAFTFNGVSSQSFDLIGKSVKRPLLPAAKVKRIELPGASGAYDFDDLEYGLRPLTMRIVYVGADYYELRQRARRITAWLGAPGWNKLILDDEKDLYYLAKITSELDLNHFWQAGSVDCVFDCQPFAYSLQEQNVPGGNFTNPGTRKIDYRSPPGSKFLITATVGNTASITINGKTLSYSGTGGTLVIDSVNMEATMGELNVFSRLSGDIDAFFTIVPGNNTMTVTGATNTTVSYIPLWL